MILRYAAFDVDQEGGNPAGVVLDAAALDADRMLAIAAEVGYSETAFLVPAPDGYAVRYFSPLAEVPFCGHATIASAVALAERDGVGDLLFNTPAGPVQIVTQLTDGRVTATLTTVSTTVTPADDADVMRALNALRWAIGELDPALPPAVANAGAAHLVLAAATRERLADLDYDYDALGALMAERGWTTVQLVWRAGPAEFQSRNPFPPGGVREDPATGAAAGAFGAYLRERGLVTPPARVIIQQGVDLGQPCRLVVDIPPGATAGIRVTGTAVRLPEPGAENVGPHR
jgi:PhzF family phenazine biosynthesis protein